MLKQLVRQATGSPCGHSPPPGDRHAVVVDSFDHYLGHAGMMVSKIQPLQLAQVANCVCTTLFLRV